MRGRYTVTAVRRAETPRPPVRSEASYVDTASLEAVDDKHAPRMVTAHEGHVVALGHLRAAVQLDVEGEWRVQDVPHPGGLVLPIGPLPRGREEVEVRGPAGEVLPAPVVVEEVGHGARGLAGLLHRLGRELGFE